MVLRSRADYELGCPLGPRSATMGFYEEWILPALIDLSMRNKRLRPYRERVAGAAEGRVLDVGIGSGLNLPFYAGQAREIFGLDPSPRLLARAQRQTQHMEIPFHLLEGSAERIPLADRSMDTIVMTWTGCSIPEIRTALMDMRRVLNSSLGAHYWPELPKCRMSSPKYRVSMPAEPTIGRQWSLCRI